MMLTSISDRRVPQSAMHALCALAFILLCLPGRVLADAAGRFQFVVGEVQVQRPAGDSRPASKGDEVFEGETIRSAANAQAQLLMSDQAIIALRPESVLTIEAHRYNGQNDGSERSSFNLLKGGFRALTGAIGRLYRENYRVRTPNATIGIRGTDHEPYYIPDPAPGEVPPGPPGTYDKVNTGATYLQSEGGRIDLGPNEIGFVANVLGAVPTQLPELPAFMRAEHAARGGAERESGDAARERARAAAQREKDPAPVDNERKPALPENRPPLPVPAPRPLSDAFDPRNPDALTVLAPHGYALAGGDVGKIVVAGSGAAVVGDGLGTLILLDRKGTLRAIKQDNFSYVANGALLSSGGLDLGGAAVRWGIYEGGLLIDGAGTRHPQYFHFVGSPNASSALHIAEALPRPGMSLSMSTVDGNPPVTESGAIGGRVALSIGLSNIAGRPMLDRYDLNVLDAQRRQWDAHLLNPLTLEDFRRGSTTGNLGVNCSGCAAAVGAGRASGVVIGSPVPLGVVTSFDLNAGSSAVGASLIVR